MPDVDAGLFRGYDRYWTPSEHTAAPTFPRWLFLLHVLLDPVPDSFNVLLVQGLDVPQRRYALARFRC